MSESDDELQPVSNLISELWVRLDQLTYAPCLRQQQRPPKRKHPLLDSSSDSTSIAAPSSSDEGDGLEIQSGQPASGKKAAGQRTGVAGKTERVKGRKVRRLL